MLRRVHSACSGKRILYEAYLSPTNREIQWSLAANVVSCSFMAARRVMGSLGKMQKVKKLSDETKQALSPDIYESEALSYRNLPQSEHSSGSKYVPCRSIFWSFLLSSQVQKPSCIA